MSTSTETSNTTATAFYDHAYTQRLQEDWYVATIGLRRAFLFEPHIDADDSVLDFGCGTGDLLELLPARKKYGVDVSDSSRAIAQTKGIDVRADLNDFAGMKFDKIISAHALEHVIDPANKLEQMASLLADDGRLVLVLPMDEWVTWSNRRWKPNDRNKHIYSWTPLLIGNLLEVCGLEPMDCRAIHHYHPPKGIGKLLARYPALYHLAAPVASYICRRRQLLAVARKSS